jgi:predicted nucleotidyltransferase
MSDGRSKSTVGPALLRKIADRIRTGYNPEKIILFGSMARGTATEDSDIDLLIIKRTSKPFHKRWAEVCRLVSDLRWDVAFSPFVLTPQELETRKALKDQFIEEILREGKVLYAA